MAHKAVRRRSRARRGGSLLLRACLAWPLSALSSCGGASPELARPSHAASAAVLRSLPARVDTRVVAPAAIPRPALPADANAEQLADERDLSSSYDSRYPLYGVAFHVLAQVYSEPSEHGEIIGYLRRGALVRASRPLGNRGCEHGWHELATSGYVCAGRGFTLAARPLGFEGAPLPPELDDALPYRYAKNTGRAMMQYWRAPTSEQEAFVQRLLSNAPPALLHAAAASDPTATAQLGLPDFARAPIEPGFYVSLDRGAVDDASKFARTVRGAYVEAASLSDVNVPAAPGVVLRGEDALPVGIVYRGGAKLLNRDPATGELRPAGTLARFASVALTGETVQQGGQSFLLTRGGELVSASQLRVIERIARPPLVPRAARLIRVDLEHQTLVAYEGGRAVFATLVSSGKEGFDTPRGVYRIYAKHVSATMDGLVPGHKPDASAPPAQKTEVDEAYSIEDVPWTMYFQGSYALHAAFWHDRFGNVRSHGCVNLAPADARWLFRWSTPLLPTGWHGVIASKENPGTWVAID
ncbi:MAG: L,D-transpeptidase [Polyangiales bacterium]